MRILLVEDDELLGDAIFTGLKQYGYTVDWTKDGTSAKHAILYEHFDTVVLDIGLPKLCGLEVLRKIRSRNITVPVLILTARDSIDDQIKGLDAGADDYLTKPFDLEILCARIRSLQRRVVDRAEPVLVYGNISMNPAARSVTKNAENIVLSRREFSLMHKLLENIGRVMSRELLSQTLYGWSDDVDSNALEVHIHNLRKKFGEHLPIRTIRGIGYMIERRND